MGRDRPGSHRSEATVLVRVWDTVPGADLAAAVDEVVAVCVGDPELGIAADAVVIGLAVGDGRSDVLIGGGWTGVVPDANAFRTEILGPPLAQGDVTGGLVAALDSLAAGVAELPAASDPGNAPPSDDRPGTTSRTMAQPPRARPRSPPEPLPEPEPETGGDGSPLAVALGVLGLGACGGAALLVNRRRTLGQERDRLRARSTLLSDGSG